MNKLLKKPGRVLLAPSLLSNLDFSNCAFVKKGVLYLIHLFIFIMCKQYMFAQ